MNYIRRPNKSSQNNNKDGVKESKQQNSKSNSNSDSQQKRPDSIPKDLDDEDFKSDSQSNNSKVQSYQLKIEDFDSDTIKVGIIYKYKKTTASMLRIPRYTKWQKRLFVLKQDKLIYYKNMTPSQESGAIALCLVKFEHQDKQAKPERLTLATGQQKIFLRFNSQEEKSEWLLAITKQQQILRDQTNSQMYKAAQMVNQNIDSDDENIAPSQNDSDFVEKRAHQNDDNESGVQQKQRGAFNKDLTDALTEALNLNIVKSDSSLSRYIAETWKVQTQLEEALCFFKGTLSKMDQSDENVLNLLEYGSRIESHSNELKNCVSIAIKEVDSTKLKIIDTLKKQDKKLHTLQQSAIKSQGDTSFMTARNVLSNSDNEKFSTPNNYTDAMENAELYHSFAQEFDEAVEDRKPIKNILDLDNIQEEEDERIDDEENDANCVENEQDDFDEQFYDANDMHEAQQEYTITEGHVSQNSPNKKNKVNYKKLIKSNEDQSLQIKKEELFDQPKEQEEVQVQEYEDPEEEQIDTNKIAEEEKEIDFDDAEEEQKEEEYQEERDVLPAFKNPNQKFSVWKVLKDAVGKDLSRFCVPVYFNEPLSMVQKVSEIMEYDDLLKQADLTDDPIKRLMYIACFGIGQYKCTINRTQKPFNPVLGETFELLRPTYKYFAEQVSHHPPVSACFCYSENFEYFMSTNMKTSFKGTYLDVKPLDYQHVKLKSRNEHYIIDRPNTNVNNIIFGNMYIEHVGESMVKCLTTGLTMNVVYKTAGWGDRTKHHIEAFYYPDPKKPKEASHQLSGKWSEQLSMTNLKTKQKELLWKANSLPEQSDQMYHFTQFALQLNYLSPKLQKKLPPTDSRLRPDLCALELADLEKAQAEKTRLEEKQRAQRKLDEAENAPYQPRYFKKVIDEDTNTEIWSYCRDYWADRAKGDWSHMLDIFSEEPVEVPSCKLLKANNKE